MKTLTYPNLCASLGGAAAVTVARKNPRIAWIQTAAGDVVRVPLKKLQPRAKWSSFNLADAAALAKEGV